MNTDSASIAADEAFWRNEMKLDSENPLDAIVYHLGHISDVLYEIKDFLTGEGEQVYRLTTPEEKAAILAGRAASA